MQYPGYWVYVDSGKAVLRRTVFDETELDPATNWKQAWQNQDADSRSKGFVELRAALVHAAQLLSTAEGKILDPATVEQATHLQPLWAGDCCEFSSLSCLQNS